MAGIVTGSRGTIPGRSRAKTAGWWLVALLLAGGIPARAAQIHGTVVDSVSGSPVVGATVQGLNPGEPRPEAGAFTDESGAFSIEWPAAETCSLRVEAFGYRPVSRRLRAPRQGHTFSPLQLQLHPTPLRMDEVLVRGAARSTDIRGPSFVQVLELDPHKAGVDLGAVVDRAVGVNVSSRGGLGSFSTVSLRGSTAEQVQVYLDGVPLNQALGGGVDLGDLPVAGVERVAVYRGAVPARFGGNSIGGVIHITTRDPGKRQRIRMQTLMGAWGTRLLSGSVSGRWGPRRYLALLELSQSDNDFEFLDDNGTEYNAEDDENARRLNNDFRRGRLLLKVGQRLGQARLQLRQSVEIKHQGVPSISSNQSLTTRLDKWRSSTEVELFGIVPASARTGFRFSLYHLVQEYEYRDLEGVVGVGHQHDRNRTSSWGVRTELDWVVFGGVATLFGRLGEERFDPRNLLRPESRLPASRRRSALMGWEAELPLVAEALRLTAGSQWQLLDDRFYGNVLFGGTSDAPVRNRTEQLWSGRVGVRADLPAGLHLKGHRGWYRRPPNFYELFGDRGAVAGNTNLTEESGGEWDVGLNWHASGPAVALQAAEIVYFHKRVDDLIRFVQNAQRVSIAHNIGSAFVRGVEVCADLRPMSRVRLEASYSYQIPENRTNASYERGNDLPNAPRHTANASTSLQLAPWRLMYQLNHEGRHFLDKANLRSVAARTLHGVEVHRQVGKNAEAGLEIRNLTDNKLADLWGYPLPGRSVFVSFSYSLEMGSGHSSQHQSGE